MVNQKWLNRETYSLFSVIRAKDILCTENAVLLLPSFSQPMCDVDYYVSRLAHKFREAGYFVMQLDPTGHGDSMGRLEDATFERMACDIKTAVLYLSNQGFKDISVITRGIMANIAISADCNELAHVIGLNPVAICPEEISSIVTIPCQGTIEIAEFTKGISEMKVNSAGNVEALLEAMGIRIRHAAGQYMDLGILDKMMAPSFLNELNQYPKGKWIFTSRSDSYEWKLANPGEITAKALSEYAVSFERDPIWQQKTMDLTLEAVSGGRKDHVNSFPSGLQR